mmetsp:Transcript_24465/g.36735  ORF Transcript_24465/g.36735 Transcript_24465/m.36735 type:complete len:80 (+) Transcript_24465:883-1122(+)
MNTMQERILGEDTTMGRCVMFSHQLLVLNRLYFCRCHCGQLIVKLKGGPPTAISLLYQKTNINSQIYLVWVQKKGKEEL